MFAGADHAAQRLGDQNMMSILWMQNAAEYRELCYQAYNIALERVDQAVKSKRKSKKPLAIVLDIDETVISTAEFNAMLVKGETTASTADQIKWSNEKKSEPMPGAVEFLNAVDKRGVEIFYVTNRKGPELYDVTLNDLTEAGFPKVKPGHLILKSDNSDKGPRIATVEEKYDVILYMGDNTNDLPLGAYGKLTEERNAIVDRNKKDFGVKYIAFPNPMYGHWERAMADGYQKMTPQQKEIARQNALRH